MLNTTISPTATRALPMYKNKMSPAARARAVRASGVSAMRGVTVTGGLWGVCLCAARRARAGALARSRRRGACAPR
jgi:hypothetical protein